MRTEDWSGGDKCHRQRKKWLSGCASQSAQEHDTKEADRNCLSQSRLSLPSGASGE